MKLLPFEAHRKTTNSLHVLIDDDHRYFVKCYLGPRKSARKTREKQMLMHWKAAGFDVPEIVEMNIPDLDEPYIVTGYVEGPSLHEYLSQDGPSAEEKLKVVTKVFEELARRHGRAVGERDRKLIHHDPSSGNIICCGEKLSFIDFESPPKSRCTVSESASIELATLCRWIVRDLGPRFLEQTLKLMVAAYKGREPLLNLVVKRTTARPFQFYHRWKNQRFKTLYPNDVTKYDIADGLMHVISQSSVINSFAARTSGIGR